jgi:hypothetical protein
MFGIYKYHPQAASDCDVSVALCSCHTFHLRDGDAYREQWPNMEFDLMNANHLFWHKANLLHAFIGESNNKPSAQLQKVLGKELVARVWWRDHTPEVQIVNRFSVPRRMP